VAPGRPAAVVRDARGRRVLEIDRRGTRVAALEWRDDGALAGARVRAPDGAWIVIEPRATSEAPWGLSDRLRRGNTPLTIFAALDWARVDCIPPLAAPARLPPGAGTDVLNLVAQLAGDQGAARLAYRGPWPSEALFLALLESFRYDEAAAGGDALAAFTRGALVWRPAPHARVFVADGVAITWRERVEKVVARGRAYYRADWQGVRRHAPRRVRDAGGLVRCSLWALGEALEDHLVLDAGGDVLEVPAPPPDAPASEPLPAAAVAGVIELVVASSAPAIGATLREAAAALPVEWGPVERDLVEVSPARARLSNRLRAVLARRVAGAATRAEALEAGLAALGEIAALVGDALRAGAQARLATASADEQARALEAPASAPDAGRIAAGAEALVNSPRGARARR